MVPVKVRIGIVTASLVLAIVIVVSLAPWQETSARERVHLLKSINPPIRPSLIAFEPCNTNSNIDGAPGSSLHPVILKRGGQAVIHICGMNQDPASKTYLFEVHDMGNPNLNFSAGNAGAEIARMLSNYGRPGQIGGGLHISYPMEITVPAYSLGAGIPTNPNLKDLNDMRSFFHTYLHGKKPDISHFDIRVSADANATLGDHGFWLSHSDPTSPPGEMNADAVIVRVVP